MSDGTARLNAALEGRYRVERLLGEGGMASVYLATDLKHDRKVALKILKPELAAVLGGDRFLQEIKVTANLQHPHILPLHDSGAADDLVFYVMPYVEGESLRERLDREKQLPVDEAVRIAVAVGSALDHAHRRDVIHRDIKPANILLQDGEPMVADFGIAIAVNAAGGTRLTDTGLSIGTPHYMSPEQAAGDRQLDGRSDVYALSAMLYEMLTGDPPFGGSTAQSVLAKILTEKAPLASDMREATPPHVAVAIRKGLAKLPADRFATAAELVEALERPGWTSDLTGPAVGAVGSAADLGTTLPTRRRRAQPWLAAGAAVAGLALGLLGGGLLRSAPDPEVLRVSLSAEDHPDIIAIGDSQDRGASAAISPDGRFIVFVGVTDDGQRLYRRDLDSFEVRELPGTDGGFDMSITPDGAYVVFYAAGGKHVIPADGGVPRLLLPGGTFPSMVGDDGFLYGTVLTENGTDLVRVPLAGGEPELIADSDSSGMLVQPQLLPDGETILASRGPMYGEALFDRSELVLVDVGSGAVRSIMLGAAPYYLESGHVVFFRETGAVHAPFDARELEFTGSVQPFYGDDGLTAFLDLAVSRTGHLVLRESVEGGGQLVWVGVDGARLAAAGPTGLVGSVDVSPDGEQIAVSIEDDIWVYPSEPGVPPLRLTLGDRAYDHPSWTRDGRFLLMRGGIGSDADIYRIAADGTGSPQLLRDEPVGLFRPSAGPGDTAVFYQNAGADSTRRDVWAVFGDWDDAREIVATEAEERAPVLSPDGRWLAYVSDRTGNDEVYVTRFPEATGQWPISNGGGWEPVWSSDGSRIFFRTSTDYRVADVETEPTFRVTDVDRLFPRGPYAASEHVRLYDVAPDGDRLVMTEGIRGATSLRLVLNWARELEEGR
ncbi:MAG: protein kinase [Longimicrobiales bacterium]|nr:protein kinase [Longimicrobiales bacterium]